VNEKLREEVMQESLNHLPAELDHAERILLGIFILECLFAIYLGTRGWW
jgi:hypothetical protein